MNNHFKTILLLVFAVAFSLSVRAQKVVQDYLPQKIDSIRIGEGKTDFLPFISKGYTLALPDSQNINGTLIFLEDSRFDKKNKNAKQIYAKANQKDFAVLSVSTELPLDFFFSEESILDAHTIIEKVFKKYKLPNKNVFVIGIGLSGHRALKYVQFIKRTKPGFQIDIAGLVICDAPLDWVRQYNEGKRDIRINFDKGAVWEGTFSTYVLEKNLKGSPKTTLENYLDFSSYSYYDEENRNIKYFKDYPLRTYMEVAIQYWLENRRKTPFDNNGPDMVGLISQVKLSGNENSEVVIIYPDDSKTVRKNPDATWQSVNKDELMQWIDKQVN